MKSHMSRIAAIMTLSFCSHAVHTAAKIHPKVISPPKVNKLAHHFHILDQISGSLPDFFQIRAYKEELPATSQNQKILDAYREVRKKYQIIPNVFLKNQKFDTHLFAPCLEQFQDPIFDAFFSHNTLDTALESLEPIMTQKDIKIIKNTFSLFDKELNALHSKNETCLYQNKKTITDHWNHDNIAQHLARMQSLYQSSGNPIKSVTLLWSPEGVSGNCYGDHLILRIPNKAIPDPNLIIMLISVLVHEATHHASSQAPLKQKKQLSKAMLKNIVIQKDTHPLLVIEEPLVMATQMLFIKKYYPKLYKQDSEWFNHPLAKQVLPLLENYIEKEKPMDLDFAKAYAKLYKKASLGNMDASKPA